MRISDVYHIIVFLQNLGYVDIEILQIIFRQDYEYLLGSTLINVRKYKNSSTQWLRDLRRYDDVIS